MTAGSGPHRHPYAAFEGDSHVEWFEGNYQDYEADKKRRLGIDADQPHKINTSDLRERKCAFDRYGRSPKLAAFVRSERSSHYAGASDGFVSSAFGGPFLTI